MRKRQAIPPEKGTSVKNIADAVGIKDATLYNHFKSKQEFFDRQRIVRKKKKNKKIFPKMNQPVSLPLLYYRCIELCCTAKRNWKTDIKE
ncbi:MAG: helix-turn-helix domain containing protein [Clostridium sp.]|nr:helix-turn-helix domain containing protein [Clostridium sp.]